jgi:hypothetical protein
MAFAPFNAFTDGKVAWAKLPDVRDRLVIGDRCAGWCLTLIAKCRIAASKVGEEVVSLLPLQ